MCDVHDDFDVRQRGPRQRFIRTEAGSAGILVLVSLLALLWANSPWSEAYVDLWQAELSVRLADHGITMDLHHWVNDGLMVVFFFVVGLEVRREFSVGELTERSRLTVPLVAGVGGHAGPRPALPAPQPGEGRRRRLGHRDRHRHRVPAGHARARRAGRVDAAADLPADPHRDRRHRGRLGHRGRLLRRDRPGPARRGGRLPGRAGGAGPGRRLAGLAVRRGRRRAVGGDARVRGARVDRGHGLGPAGAGAQPGARPRRVGGHAVPGVPAVPAAHACNAGPAGSSTGRSR